MTNIYEKIAAIQEAVPRLKKDGEMEMGGGKKLKFLGIDTILDAVKPLLVQHKVIILPTLVTADSHIKYGQEPPSEVDTEKWSGKIPTKSIREKVVYDWTWVDTENPESRHTVRMSGEAMDTQDKASGKAFTSCQKSMLIKVLELITGDPEIEDGTTEEPEAKQDRGAQQREQARPSAAKKSTTTTANPTVKRATEKLAQEAAAAPEGDAPAEPALPVDAKADKLLAAKKRLVAANVALGAKLGIAGEGDAPGLGLSKVEVDAIALEITGKTRDKWVGLLTDLNKIAAHVEGLAAAAGDQVEDKSTYTDDTPY